MRKTLVARILAATIALVGLADPATAGNDTGADEMTFVAKINAERTAAGLAPLSVDGRLFDSARAWSNHLVAVDTLAHDASFFTTGRLPGADIQGENVAYNSTVEDAHARLMASEGHRANILNPAYNVIGVGEVQSPDGRIFVTERFASVSASAPAPVVARKSPVRRTHRHRSHRPR